MRFEKPMLVIRPARIEEASDLHGLSVRSKAHWGYDEAFMSLASPKLQLPPEWIAAGRVFVAEFSGSNAGVAAILPPDHNGTSYLEHLFVSPGLIGKGIGTALLETCVTLANQESAIRIHALADPHARLFYERYEFECVSDVASDAIPGRMLPLMERTLRAT